MEVGPTTHYIMGGVRVDGDTQMSTVPGLFAAGECAAGPARRQPAGRQLALRPAGVRQARRRVRGEVRQGEARRARSTRRRSTAAARGALAPPFERGAAAGATPRAVQDPARAAGHDAGDRRHRAQRGRDEAGAGRDRGLKRSARERVGVDGNREYNPGWHTALDPAQPADRVRGDRARARSSARRAAAATSATTSPDKEDRRSASSTSSCKKGADGDGRCSCAASRSRADAGDDLKAGHRGEQVMSKTATFPASGAASARPAGSSRTTRPRSARAWSCSTPCTRSRPSRPTTWRCAGTARPASAARARRRSTACPS